MSIGSNSTKAHRELQAAIPNPLGIGETAYFGHSGQLNLATGNYLSRNLMTDLQLWPEGRGSSGGTVSPAAYSDFSGWIGAPTTPAQDLCNLQQGLYFFRVNAILNGLATEGSIYFGASYWHGNGQHHMLRHDSGGLTGEWVLPFFSNNVSVQQDFEAVILFSGGAATELDYLEFYITPIMLYSEP